MSSARTSLRIIAWIFEASSRSSTPRFPTTAPSPAEVANIDMPLADLPDALRARAVAALTAPGSSRYLCSVRALTDEQLLEQLRTKPNSSTWHHRSDHFPALLQVERALPWPPAPAFV